MFLLCLLIPTAQADDILFIYGESPSSSTPTANLVSALEAAGHTVTLSDTDETGYNGTNPSPSGFNVVIHHDGTTYATDMPTAGQTTLVSWVQSGGGYINTAWIAWEEDAGRNASLTDLILFEHRNGDTCNLTETFTPVSSQTGHDLAYNLTSGFTINTCTDQAYARTFATDPSTVIFEDSRGYDAVVARELGSGRAVNFSFAPNYSTGVSILSDSNVQQLYINAVAWTGYCHTSTDHDGDGLDAIFCGGTDCDDDDASTGAAATWYADSDGDGFGDLGATVSDCDQPSSYVSDSSDCDDSDASVNTSAVEYCDNIDNNCDGNVDEDSAADAATWYADSDGDGFGDLSNTTAACDQPTGYLSDSADCDDGDASVNPDADEYCDSVDNDCDSSVDEDGAVDVATWYADSDQDGYGDASVTDIDCDQPNGYVTDATDCDDSANTTYPNATEYCDGVDNNCDGDVDEDSAVDVATWYADSDQDGYGDASVTDVDCDQPNGYVVDDSDCDDSDANTYPSAPEVPYDGVDQDCDGADLCDSDGDGFSATECGGDDCADGDSSINPDAAEIFYDDVDQNCDGASDFDADADGFDSAAYGGDDCDDANADTYPGAPDEPNDGIINDCDASDEYDGDGDGFLSAAGGGDDCDDANSSINPDADEIWYDGVDQDCDGNDDDQDYDGFPLEQDCDDTDPDVYAGADGYDENCEPLVNDSGLDDTGIGGDDKGCSCGATRAPSGLAWAALVGLLALVRRRRG